MTVAELAETNSGDFLPASATVRRRTFGVQWDETAEQECRTHLRLLKAIDRLGCPFCTAPLDWLATTGIEHTCLRCHRVFSDKVGTIFEYSKLPLAAWFAAIARLTGEGCTSAGLAKTLSITQTSAWFLLNTLKTSALSNSFRAGARLAGPGSDGGVVATRPQIDAAIHGRPARLPMAFGAALNGFVRTLPQDLTKPGRRADRRGRRKAM